MNTEEQHIVNLIIDELRKAEKKHPGWPVDPIHADAIINEEKGEMTRAVLQFNYEYATVDEITKECLQTAAMCIRFLKNEYVIHDTVLNQLK